MPNDFNIADGPGVPDGSAKTNQTGQLILGDDGTSLQTVQVTTAGILKVDGSAVTQPVSAVSLPLPSGASTDRTTAAGPYAVRLSDGTNFYNTNSASQLPAALVGGRLDVNIGAGAVSVSGATQNPMYRAVFKPTGTAIGLSNTFTANTGKQYATLFHTVGSTKTVKIRGIWFQFVDNSSNNNLMRVEVLRLTATTAPATGNPVITAALANTGDASHEVSCLALPTTQGSEGSYFITTAHSVANGGGAQSPDLFATQPIYTWENGREAKPITLRAGVAEGIAIRIFSQGGSTITAEITVEFTEE